MSKLTIADTIAMNIAVKLRDAEYRDFFKYMMLGWPSYHINRVVDEFSTEELPTTIEGKTLILTLFI